MWSQRLIRFIHGSDEIFPRNFDEVRALTLGYMRTEDDVSFRRKRSNDKRSLSVKKSDFKIKGTIKSKTAQQFSNVRFEKGKSSSKTPQPPKLSSYDFAGTPKDLVEF